MKEEIRKLKEELSFAQSRVDTITFNGTDIIEKLEGTNLNVSDVITEMKNLNTRADVLQKGIIEGSLVADNLLAIELRIVIRT